MRRQYITIRYSYHLSISGKRISTKTLRYPSNGRNVLAPVITQNEEYNHWSRLEQVFRLGVSLACFGCRFGRYCSITCTNLANRGESSLEAGTKRKSLAGKRTPKGNQAAGPKYDGILVDSNHCETFAKLLKILYRRNGRDI